MCFITLVLKDGKAETISFASVFRTEQTVGVMAGGKDYRIIKKCKHRCKSIKGDSK